MMIRKRWARVSSAKTTPVVKRYAFMTVLAGETVDQSLRLIPLPIVEHYSLRNRDIIGSHLSRRIVSDSPPIPAIKNG